MRIRRIFLLIALALIPLAGRTQLFEFPPSEPLELHRPLTNEARQQQRSAAQLENRGESAKALAIYRQLFDLYPEYDPFYEGIIRCLMTGEQYDLGLSFIDSLRRGLTAQVSLQNLNALEQERAAKLIVDGGRFAGRLGRREEAFSRWEDIYRLPRPSAGAFFRLMSAMIDSRYPDGLEAMVEKARKATGDPSLLGTSLAGYWAEHGQVDRAVQELLRLMEIQPRQAAGIQQQILAFPEDERTAQQVESTLQAAKVHEDIRINVTQMLAQFYFRNRQWEKAYGEVRSLDQWGPGQGEAMLGFAETLNTEGEAPLTLRVLEDMGKAHPALAASSRAHLAQGRALEALRRYIEADSVYGLITGNGVLRSAQEQEALLLQGKLKLERLHEPGAARDLLLQGLQHNSRLRSRGEITLLIGDTYLADRDLEKARQTYLEAAQMNSSNEPELKSRALVNAAQVDVYLGEVGRAIERLQEASRGNPEGLLTNDALELLALLHNGQEDSLALAKLCQADLERKLGRMEIAKSLYISVSESAQIGELAERAYGSLAELYRSEHQPEQAMAAWQQALSRFPQSMRAPEVLLKMGEIYEQELANPKEAIGQYEKILIDYPNSLSVEEARRRIRNLESAKT